MATGFDDFESYTLGTSPTGFTARNFGTWTHNIATVNSQKSVVFDDGGAGGSQPRQFTMDSADAVTGQMELMIGFRFDQALGGNQIVVATIFCNVSGDGTEGYILVVDDTAHTISISQWNNGIGVAIGTPAAFTAAASTDYLGHWGRDASGNWRAKVWSGGAASEPGGAGSALTASPMFTSTSTDTTYTSGFSGPANNDFHVEVSFYQCGWGSAGSIAPSSAFVDSTAPTYGANPHLTQIDYSTATFAATASDETAATVDHYMAVYVAGSTPTAANVKAGTGTGLLSSSARTQNNITNGVEAAFAQITANLVHGVSYRAAFTVEEHNGGNLRTVFYVDFTMPSYRFNRRPRFIVRH